MILLSGLQSDRRFPVREVPHPKEHVMKGLPSFLMEALIIGSSCAVAVNVRANEPLQPPTGSDQILVRGEQLAALWTDGEFTEGVATSPDGKIYFSDIAFAAEEPGRILVYDPVSGKTSVHCADSGKSNGLMFDARGRLLAACGANRGKQALCMISPDGSVRTLAGRFEGKRFNAPNDLVIHPRGWVYFSDPRYVGKEPVEIDHQSVYRWSEDGRVARVTSDIEKPNGVHVSPDGKTLYVAETNNGSFDVTITDPPPVRGRMTLNAFPILPDGTLGERRVLVDFKDQLGTDGMTIDREGHIYAAVRSESRFGIRVYDPTGTEIAYIPTPELPTNCTFGIHQQASVLYITAGKGLYSLRVRTKGYHPAIRP